MARLPYRIVDVFTERPFRGNPLAVVLGADDLTTGQLGALAREFNLSETAFPVAADRDGADYRLRIFTPGMELPFAGHPSVGAAWVMATEGGVAVAAPSTTLTQSCGAGLLPLRVTVETDGTIGPVELTAGTPDAGPPVDPALALAGFGLAADDLAPGRAFRICSTGLPQAFLCVGDEAVRRSKLDPAALQVAAAAGGWQTLSVFSWDDVNGLAHARVAAEGIGWGEDPATGSAATGLGAWLAAEGLVAGDGSSTYAIRQGAEIGRDSVLHGTVVTRGGVAVECRVAGRVAAVASGEIEIPPA
jgi:trans-2,3-dihydro-3-hydroxyanthranilate isomerase